MSRYSNARKYKRRSTGTQNGKIIQGTTCYPLIPLNPSDLYVITTDGDRLDSLSLQYYGDVSHWWIISAANVDLAQNSLYIPTGTHLRIPVDVNNIIASYISKNY